MSNYSNCNQNLDNLVNVSNERIYNYTMSVGNVDVLIEPRPQQTLFTLPYQNVLPPFKCAPHVIQYYNSTNLTKSTRDYMINIDKESQLKNLDKSLDRNPANKFIPKDDSELFNNKQSTLDLQYEIRPLPVDLGNKLFYNSTRQNTKDN